jgi:N-acetylglucosamine-6-phosphate deacetylase
MVFATAGLFDAQINGFMGRGFKDVDLGPENVRDLCWSILLTGTTCFLPTITTDSPETMRKAMAHVDAACRAYPDVAAMVAGIHQEGPWISSTDGPRGAHPLAHVSTPNRVQWRQLQETSGNRIKLLTLAPEVEGALDFIREVTAQGIVVSLGHHEADGPTIRRAVEAGARSVTHLGNGCHAMIARHQNIIWEQAADDRLSTGVIADGQHLPPTMVKVFYRSKPSDKLFLVSDAISMAGAPPGLYHVRDSIAQMTPEGWFGFYGLPLLMGAAMALGRCLANFCQFVDEHKTPADYVPYATDVPASLLNVLGITSSLGEPGTPATFVVWRWDRKLPDLVPQRIVVRGRTVFDAEKLPTRVPFGRSARPASAEEGEHWLAQEHQLGH